MRIGSRLKPLLQPGNSTLWVRWSRMLAPATLACTALLAACSEGRITPGVGIRWQAALAAQPPAAAGPKSFTTTEGLQVTLTTGFLTVSTAALTADCNQPGFVFNPLDWLVPTAHAHTQSTPLQLGEPTVIGLTAADLVARPLGVLSPAAGNYCGGRWQIAAADADARGLPDDLDMVGYSLRLRGRYGPDASDFAVDTTISLLPIERRFAAGLPLDEEHRTAVVTLALHYDRWFDGVDMDALRAGERNALELLLNNLRTAASVTVDAEP